MEKEQDGDALLADARCDDLCKERQGFRNLMKVNFSGSLCAGTIPHPTKRLGTK